MVVALSALPAARTGAQVVTVGSPLGTQFSAFERLVPGTVANLTLADPSAHVVSPIDGAVVGISLVAPNESGGPFRIRVLRPSASESAYTAVASSRPLTFSEGEAPERRWPRIPIRAGDTVGLDLLTGARIGIAEGQPGSTMASWVPRLLSSSPTPPTRLTAGREVGFNAKVLPTPTISSVVPSAARPGTPIRIRGTDLSYVTTTKIAGKRLIFEHRRSERLIEGLVPHSPANGARPVVVSTLAGKARARFRYLKSKSPAR